MMHADPPEHTRYRKLVRPGFTNQVVRQLEVLVRRAHQRARSTTLAVEGRGRRAVVDVTAELAIPLPIQLIAQLLGLPAGRRGAALPLVRGGDPRRHRLVRGGARRAARRDDHRAARPWPPTAGASPVTTSCRCSPTYEEDGEALTDDELGMFLIQLLVAGNETTRNAISGALVALAEHPEQLDRLAADPSAGSRPPSRRCCAGRRRSPRSCAPRCRHGASAARRSQPVTRCCSIYAAANRDEAEFGPTADTFDVDRTPNHHVALGHGPHFCLGAALARLELLRGARGRRRRAGAACRVAGPVVRSGSSVISGIKSAPLTLEAAVSESLRRPPRHRHRRGGRHRCGDGSALARPGCRGRRPRSRRGRGRRRRRRRSDGHAITVDVADPAATTAAVQAAAAGDGRAHRRRRQRRHGPEQAAPPRTPTRSGGSSSASTSTAPSTPCAPPSRSSSPRAAATSSPSPP